MVKERWSSDPNGNNWAKDNTKFGQKMLESMGWKEGDGLGIHGNGMASHVKVQKRSKNLGLGADQGTPDRWGEHITEFDDILGKLNSMRDKKDESIVKKPDVQDSAATTDRQSRKRKKATNLYTKFKKHKDLSSLSNKELAHIFGEKSVADEKLTSQVNVAKEESGNAVTVESNAGFVVMKSKFNMEEYFNSKKLSKKPSRTS